MDILRFKAFECGKIIVSYHLLLPSHFIVHFLIGYRINYVKYEMFFSSSGFFVLFKDQSRNVSHDHMVILVIKACMFIISVYF